MIRSLSLSLHFSPAGCNKFNSQFIVHEAARKIEIESSVGWFIVVSRWLAANMKSWLEVNDSKNLPNKLLMFVGKCEKIFTFVSNDIETMTNCSLLADKRQTSNHSHRQPQKAFEPALNDSHKPNNKSPPIYFWLSFETINVHNRRAERGNNTNWIDLFYYFLASFSFSTPRLSPPPQPSAINDDLMIRVSGGALFMLNFLRPHIEWTVLWIRDQTEYREESNINI